VVVIPRHVADEVAAAAQAQELLEVFIIERVRNGAALPGTYPPDAKTLAAYEEWSKKRNE
jgi:regulator of RNase E activity RraA